MAKRSDSPGLERPPFSAQRTAEFKLVVRDLLTQVRSSPTGGQSILRQLEAAYARGFYEARFGVPEEPDAGLFLPWIQIPARARGVFADLCRLAFRRTTQPKWENAKRVLLRQYEPGPYDFSGKWVVFCEGEADRADAPIGRTTIAKLVDLGLLEELNLDGQHWVMISRYGFETWVAELRSNSFPH